MVNFFFFFSSRRRHTRLTCDWSSDVCSSDLGIWQTFVPGEITDGKAGAATIRLAPAPMSLRFLRILMTASSNTCDTHGSENPKTADPRNCVGYAIREL